MKKLFYSFFVLIAMSLTFVACDQKEPEPEPEPEPEIQSNCSIFKAQYGVDKQGVVYIFEIFSNTLAVNDDMTAITGSGDDCMIMMYASAAQEDGYPTAKEYSVIAPEDLTEESNDCVVGGMAYQGQPIGTFAYVIENGQAVDGLLCTEGSIKFEGNATKGIMTAKLKFENSQGEIVEREYIYNGKMSLEEMPMNAPVSKVRRIK
ncbi:MAG: hypothetical protein IJY67_06360 [Paludibacteraceae bacterium]|nr:hypothetical protein [Paludibacteraceae bacterium]